MSCEKKSDENPCELDHWFSQSGEVLLPRGCLPMFRDIFVYLQMGIRELLASS